MQERASTALCCVTHCPNQGPHIVENSLGQWIITAHFCREHERERLVGTPMGGVGIDPCRLQVRPQETAEPKFDGNSHAISPQ